MSFFKSKITTLHLSTASVYSPTAMLRSFSSPSPKKIARNQRNERTAFYEQLIQITLTDNKFTKHQIERTLHDHLSHGWNISHSGNRIYYRLKPVSDFIESVIVCETLHDVLVYSFDTFLDLINKLQLTQYDWRLQWVYSTYCALIDCMTLEQKAMIFCKCSNRKNRKYKLIHKYKDCIIGKEGVDFLVAHQICKNRKAAVDLGQEFIDKGYMAHVTHAHAFKDTNNLWYRFYDESIQYKHEHFMRYSDDYKDESITVDVNDDDDGYTHHVSSDEEDNDFLLRDIANGINSTKVSTDEMNINLGTNRDAVIEYLLSLHPVNELECMFEEELNGLIKSPQMGLTPSVTNIADSECVLSPNAAIVNDDLFIGYQNKMSLSLKMGNQYALNVKPFTMKNISNKQRNILMRVQSMTFETYLSALHYILCSLWEIYNDLAVNIYLKLVQRLCLVEKAKMLSIGIEIKNRVRNLKKYRNCFIGCKAVAFCVDAKLTSCRSSAVSLGNTFYKKKWIKHVKNEHIFEDSDLFYVFIEDELENRLDELRLYRKQQQSNHVKLSLDIVASPRTLLYAEESVDSDEILIDWNESTKSVTDNNDTDPSYPHFISKSISNVELNASRSRSHKKTKSSSLDVEPFYD